MSKVISIVALVVAIAACVLTQWVYTHQQKELERALKQREAQLSQRYAGLINRMIDRIGSGHSLAAERTIEEALKRLEQAIESSHRSPVEETRPHVDNVGNLEPAQIQFGKVGEFASHRKGFNGFTSEASGEAAEPITLAGQIVSTDDDAVDLQSNQTEFIPVEGRIVFISDDGDGEIYAINADGSNKTRLTRNDVHDLYPTWSPDGQQIAFVSDASGKRELYIMNERGHDIVQITDNDLTEGTPSWSADGNRIAVSVFNDRNAKDVHIISVDGSADPIVIADASTPSWSPDGKQLAFNRGLKIYLVNADGTSEKLLISETDGARSFAMLPRWSPDGKQIMYTGVRVAPDARNPEDVTFGVQLFDVKSEQSHRISTDQINQIGLDWSADGKHLVYLNLARKERAELCVMSVSGANPFALTRAANFDAWASWRGAP